MIAQNMLTQQPSGSPITQSQGYSGTVMFQGTPVQVQGGKAHVMDEDFIVSDDGRIVVDSNRRFVGTIQNGEFIQATPELIDQFSKEGIFEQ